VAIGLVSDGPATMDALMRPRSIAVVGASQRRTRGTKVLLNLKTTGFKGAVYAINPRYDEVEGFPCYPNVSAVPEAVDCVVAAIPADGVPPTLEDAYTAGARGAVVLSSGFGEGGHENAERVARLRQLATQGMSICGPNCYGVLNLHTGAAAFSGGIAEPLVAGPVGLISQSGGLANVISDPLMEDRGIGFSYLISCGNQLGVAVEDYMEYLVDDPVTRVIAAFVEGFRKPDKLPEIAARAREAGKPIIVLKSGQSEAGKAASRSHTGSLGGSAEVLASLLRRHGFVQVYGIDQLIETISLFAGSRNQRAFRREMVIVTGNGGEGSHVADAAEFVGIGLVKLADDTKQRIEAVLPEFGEATNPVDGTGAMFESPELFPSLVDAVLSDPHEGGIAFNLNARDPGAAWAPMRGFAKILAEKSAATDKVIVAYGTSALGPTDREMLDALNAAGIPYAAGTQHAMQALASLYEYRQYRERAAAAGPSRVSTVVARPGLPGGVLPFLTARAILSDFGIPIVATELAQTREEAVAAAERLGYPVALKVEAPNLTHKTDVGGVVLGSRDAQSVAEAFDSIVANVKRFGHEVIDGVLVQPMSRFGVEVFAGVTVDPIVGPAVLFGLGGIFVEVIRDTVVEVPPLSQEQARAMVLGIRARQILEGARGADPADVDAISRVLVGLGDFALAYRDRLMSIDINPILAGTAGKGAVAVDALVELRDA
jgi:acyl-CoA synthetase (NDP forming)